MPRKSLPSTTTLRAKHLKSRRACATCKARRIRCDETTPLCRNCSSSGRVCDGVASTQFTFVTPRIPGKKAPLLPQLSLFEHSQDECRSFDFFLANVAPLFGVENLDASFWGILLPQLSKSHPTVWDSMVAIALLFEHPIQPYDHSGTLDQIHPLDLQQFKALKWYSRAVSRVARRTDLGADDEIQGMLTCVLFTALEIQQGHMSQGMVLIERGIELLFSYLSSPAASERSPESRAIAEVLIPFFSRHAIFMATLGLPLMSGWPQPAQRDQRVISEQAALKSLEVLNHQLHELIYQAHHLIRRTLLILHNPVQIWKHQIAPEQQKLLKQLTDWNHRFSIVEDSQQPEHAWMSSTLLMYFLVTYTWISTCLATEQTCFDAYHETFEQIVYHANTIITARSLSSSGLEAPYGVGCIPPLYFTATKCRDPVIRRWALNIIRRIPKQNSIWATIHPEAIIERLIAFEESTPGFQPVPTSHDLPAEHRRVHHVQLLSKLESLRLWTYPPDHSSDPKYIQTHIALLSKPGEAQQPEVREGPSFDTVLPKFEPHPRMNSLFYNLTAYLTGPQRPGASVYHLVDAIDHEVTIKSSASSPGTSLITSTSSGRST